MSTRQEPGGRPGHPAGSGRADGDGSRGGADDQARVRDRSPWNWLLLVPLLVTLLPPLYNRLRPELLGMPFFYWYQFLAIAVGVGCTLVVYLKTRRH